ncbi:MAG TPA: trigger factor, partial [Chitinophagaceae bacterium]|nr:trigger factor [Chitinophagaceae bacterium]
IKKMYGASVLTDEVLRTVEKELTKYMVDEKLNIFAQPLPLPENDAGNINVDNPADYVFAFEVGLKPEFSLPDLSTATVHFYQVKVTEEMIENEVSRLRLRHGKMEEPEVISSEDNVLNVKFIEVDESGNEIEGGIQKDNSLLLKYFAPSAREQWMGKKSGDLVVLQLSTAFEDRERDWVLQDLALSKEDPASQNKFFKVLLTKVGLVVKADLNEEFFKVAYPAKDLKTEDDLRNLIRDDMEQHWKRQGKNMLQHEIYHFLVDKTQIEFPETFLKRWLKQENEQKKSVDDVEQEFPYFVNQLKWTLISEKIHRENSLEVSQEDIKAFARQQLAGYMGMNVLDESQGWVKEYLNKMMQDRKFVEDTYHRLQNEKVLEFAETKVNPVEKEISAEAFHELQHQHKH